MTAELRSGTDASFLGRKLRHNGDGIDMFMPQMFIDELLALYNVKDSNSANTTGSASLKRLEDSDLALDPTEHANYRTALGELLWMA